MANKGVGNLGFGGGSVGSSGGLPIVVVTSPQTPSVIDVSGLVGNTLNTWKSFSFVVNEGTILINGEQFQRGVWSFGNGNGVLNPISYDATGSSNCKIMTQI